ncbi:MAG TPA: hypothetical protein VFC44_02095 [Candidatus Saccharimonadales bacterium]|nr:hypothetical protein [Candidatus Saccharimonadales bacterium]
MNHKPLLGVAALILVLIGSATAASVKQDTNGNVVLTIDGNTQKRIEVQVEPAVAATQSPEVKGYGRVIDPAPLIAQTSELATAQAAYVASSNDLVRLKTLEGQGNTSAHAVQTAEAAALRDQLAVQSASDRLALSSGRILAKQEDLAAFIHRLTSDEIVLVRIDVPVGEGFPASPIGARIVDLSGKTIEAKFLGAVPAVDPALQGAGFIFVAKTKPANLLFGESVAGYLQFAGRPVMGVAIPRNAVVRSQGAAWVYLKSGEETFTRIEIDLGQPIAGGWFVTQGVKAGDPLVTNPPQLLLSEELKASITAGRD